MTPPRGGKCRPGGSRATTGFAIHTRHSNTQKPQKSQTAEHDQQKGENVSRTDRHTVAPGAGLPARLLALCLLLLCAPLVLASPASADTKIGAGPGFLTEGGPGGINNPLSLAVSRAAGGDVYLLDGGSNQRVEQFDPSKPPSEQFVRAFGWGIVPGTATVTGNLTNGSNSLTNAAAVTGRLYAGELLTGPGIPAGTGIEEVTATEVKLSNPAEATQTAATLTVAAGPGNVPTNEDQKLAVSATSGKFKLSFASPNPGSSTATTGELQYNASATEVQEALEALANLGAGNVSVSGGPGDEKGEHPYLIEFSGKYADANLRTLTATAVGLAGGSPTSAATVTTSREGAGVLETCTTACTRESVEEGRERAQGSEPGQLRWSDEIAVDNSCAEQEPPLIGSACGTFDSSYGDVYLVDQRNYRIEKYDSEGHFLLMFGGQVNKTKVQEGKPEAEQDLCKKADLEAGDVCGVGLPGTGPAHFYREEPQTQAGGRKDWAHEGSNSITVGPDGTVYVGDYGRIQEFDGEGAFTGEFAIPLALGEEPDFVSALALDASGDLFERSVVSKETGGFIRQVPGVREWNPAHSLLRTFDAGAEEAGSEPTHIALDSKGDLFLSDFNGGHFRFRAFKPSGSLYAEFTSELLAVTNARNPFGIGVDESLGNLYASTTLSTGTTNENRVTENFIAVHHPLPEPGPPAVTELHVTDTQPTTATLHAVVNPEQFDTEYRLQWITEKKFHEDGNSFGAGAEATAFADLGSVSREDPVQHPLSGLQPGTAYRWRVLAQNHCHENSELCETVPEETFETLPPVSVRNFTTQTVAPELVELKAELNPNNSSTKAKYTIHYGKEAGNYSLGSCHGELEVGGEFDPVSCTFTGLQPNTEYHYQLLAEDSYTSPGHLLETPDQAFTTEPSAAEAHQAELSECPNLTRREENGSTALPDCRAYEQVSASDKAGGAVFPVTSLAPDGERLLYQSNGAFAGTGSNELTDLYIAHHTPAGWATQPMIAAGVAPLGTDPHVDPTTLLFGPQSRPLALLRDPRLRVLPQLRVDQGNLSLPRPRRRLLRPPRLAHRRPPRRGSPSGLQRAQHRVGLERRQRGPLAPLRRPALPPPPRARRPPPRRRK